MWRSERLPDPGIHNQPARVLRRPDLHDLAGACGLTDPGGSGPTVLVVRVVQMFTPITRRIAQFATEVLCLTEETKGLELC